MIKKFVLFVCLFLMPLTLVSETQHRFRVFLHVFEAEADDDPYIRKILETNLKKELRLLEDVDIVDIDEDWHFILDVHCIENKFTSGRKTGQLSIAEGFYERVPRSYFKADRYPHFRQPPVYAHRLGVASCPRDRLEAYCVDIVGAVDKEFLTPIRELLR